MITPQEAKAQIALYPYQLQQELDELIERAILEACRTISATAWPAEIRYYNENPDYDSVIDQVVDKYAASGWGIRTIRDGGSSSIFVDKPT